MALTPYPRELRVLLRQPLSQLVKLLPQLGAPGNRHLPQHEKSINRQYRCDRRGDD
jgi:hypothetical protein